MLSIAASLRRLFARHGGFAPSARHAAATGTTVTRHWLRNHGVLAPLSEQRKAAAATAMVGGGRAGVAAGVRSVVAAAAADQQGAAPKLPSQQQPWDILADPVIPGAAACATADSAVRRVGAEAGAGAGAGTLHGQGAFPLLVDVDLGGGYREPWLTPGEVRAAITRHAARRQQEQQEQQGDGVECSGGAGAPAAVDGLHGASSGSSKSSSTTDRCSDEEGGSDSKSSSSGGDEGQGHGVCEGAGAGTAAGRGGDEGGDAGAEEGGGDPWDGLPWLDANPLGVPTEREVYVERGGRHIYRLLLVRV